MQFLSLFHAAFNEVLPYEVSTNNIAISCRPPTMITLHLPSVLCVDPLSSNAYIFFTNLSLLHSKPKQPCHNHSTLWISLKLTIQLAHWALRINSFNTFHKCTLLSTVARSLTFSTLTVWNSLALLLHYFSSIWLTKSPVNSFLSL